MKVLVSWKSLLGAGRARTEGKGQSSAGPRREEEVAPHLQPEQGLISLLPTENRSSPPNIYKMLTLLRSGFPKYVQVFPFIALTAKIH